MKYPCIMEGVENHRALLVVRRGKTANWGFVFDEVGLKLLGTIDTWVAEYEVIFENTKKYTNG